MLAKGATDVGVMTAVNGWSWWRLIFIRKMILHCDKPGCGVCVCVCGGGGGGGGGGVTNDSIVYGVSPIFKWQKCVPFDHYLKKTRALWFNTKQGRGSSDDFLFIRSYPDTYI